ncbi:hypothetical protein FRC09_013711 [Ceratobasidium sp. 395]|nr:hypothetical protein FRC09_013711 [Ceratobasidium sp. 395]
MNSSSQPGHSSNDKVIVISSSSEAGSEASSACKQDDSEATRWLHRFVPYSYVPDAIVQPACLVLDRMARVDYFDAIRFGVNEETLPACHFALTGMARLLERQTGAVVYCAAVWVDEQDATHYYKCTNDSLSDILVRDDTMIVRGRLVELIRHQLGPTLQSGL